MVRRAVVVDIRFVVRMKHAFVFVCSFRRLCKIDWPGVVHMHGRMMLSLATNGVKMTHDVNRRHSLSRAQRDNQKSMDVKVLSH